MVHPTQQRQPARKKAPLPTITLVTSGKVRTFRVRPWLTLSGLAFAGTFLVLYLAATAYLVYRDDLLGATISRQVALQYDYEDRIAALRTELDRVTSRHLVETQSVESQMASVIERQASLDRRQAVLDDLIRRARETGIALAEPLAPLPRQRPELTAAAPAAASPHALGYAGQAPHDDIITGTLFKAEDGRKDRDEVIKELRPVLKDVQSSLDSVQSNQAAALDALISASAGEAERLSAALAPIGIGVPAQAAGGPFIPAKGAHFVEKTATLQKRLDELAGIRRAAATMPLRAPIEGAKMSSRFGNRTDPFLGRPAFHAGIDFVSAPGSLVRATAPGVVASAGVSGGYGKLVEIRHAGGVSTRFGHLSEILVRKGQRIAAGDVIGRVGSTGRSTGPHLHYETRKKGKPVDPALYLGAGRLL